MNNENVEFYNKVGPKNLKDIGAIISIDDCMDLERIQDMISCSSHVLEIGGGYGRVIKYITNNFPEKKMTCIERSVNMHSYLKQNYSNIATLLNESVLDFKISKKMPDLILWMWSGFLDISEDEQAKALKNLYDNSSIEAKLVLDLPDPKLAILNNGEGKMGNFSNPHRPVINHPTFGHYEGFLPKANELLESAFNVGFGCILIDEYMIQNSPRTQYIFIKNR